MSRETNTQAPTLSIASALALAGALGIAHDANAQCQHWNSILIGDVNLYGVVDILDLAIIYDNMALGHTEATWLQGDLNRDGKVDMDDFDLALAAFYVNACIDDIPLIAGTGTWTNTTFDPATGRVEWDGGTHWLTVTTESLNNRRPLHADFPLAEPDPLNSTYVKLITPTISLLEARPDGMDLLVEWEHDEPNSDAMGQGALLINSIRLVDSLPVEGNAGYRDFRDQIRKHDYRPLSDAGSSFVVAYPQNMYSPAHVYQTENFDLGIAVKYDILANPYPILFQRGKSVNSTTERLRIEPNFDNRHPVTGQSPSKNGRPNPDEFLSYGETKSLIVTLRLDPRAAVSLNGNDWMSTLLPYRRHFRHLYSDVRYTQDPRPMAGATMAFATSTERCPVTGNRNPYGFAGGLAAIHNRPNQDGFTDIVNQSWLASGGYYDKGWPRMMLWKGSGEYNAGGMAWQITTNWKAANQVASSDPSQYRNAPCFSTTDIENSLPELAKIYSDDPEDPRELGLWWGRATRYVPNGYAGTAFEWPPAGGQSNIDRNNPIHTGSAFLELEGAYDVNATFIGLDACFTHMRASDLYWWIDEMTEAWDTFGEGHPSVRFMTELGTADFIHTKASAFFYYDLASAYSDNTPLPQNVVLADFLNPGHESFGGIQRPGFSGSINPTETGKVAEAIVQDGMIPLIILPPHELTVIDPTKHYGGQPWLTTVPSSMQP
ncbi:MAG: hypothetical protein EA378_05885 [Phycisphaerales bacterium]|nr:MAG: hypothetical protein EA378_05885 [Phycisphaerales bacterium]